MWNFGNRGIEDFVPITLGQLVALMVIMAIKIFCKNLLIILNLLASQILSMLILEIGYSEEVEKLLSDYAALSSAQSVVVELHDL